MPALQAGSRGFKSLNGYNKQNSILFIIMLSEGYKKRIIELAGIHTEISINKPGELNDNFRAWFQNSKVSKDGIPTIVHHGTGSKFKKFNLKKTTQGIIWFTSDKSAVESGEVGAQGKGHIMDLYVSIQNPAGWEEYNKYGLGQIKGLGFDGVILPEDNSFTGFVFHPNQLKSVLNDGSWDINDNNIFS